MLVTKPNMNLAFAFLLALICAGVILPDKAIALAQAAGPFANLPGKWAGEGTIVLTNGTTERLRCDAAYLGGSGSDNVELKLHCVSDSYHFDLRVSLVDTAGSILGNWSETNQNVEGGISGTSSNGVIDVTARGQAFTAAIVVSTHGSEQSVKIRADSGNLSQVTITLHHAH